jgi:phosphatidylglycerophosphate synthase
MRFREEEMKPFSFVDARREQNGILAGVEARILRWMAARMPDRINSDHLTALGFLAMLAAGVAYALSREDKLFLHLVNGCLVLNWMGDSLDGTLARYRNRLRPRYGFYVDHILDTISMSILLAGLALSDYMSFGVAGLVLIVYFMLCINVYLATYTIGTFKISFGRLSPTELRLLLAVGNLVLLFQPTVRLMGGSYRLFDVGGMVAVILMTGILIATTIQNIRFLYNAERLP